MTVSLVFLTANRRSSRTGELMYSVTHHSKRSEIQMFCLQSLPIHGSQLQILLPEVLSREIFLVSVFLSGRMGILHHVLIDVGQHTQRVLALMSPLHCCRYQSAQICAPATNCDHCCFGSSVIENMTAQFRPYHFYMVAEQHGLAG